MLMRRANFGRLAGDRGARRRAFRWRVLWAVRERRRVLLQTDGGVSPSLSGPMLFIATGTTILGLVHSLRKRIGDPHCPLALMFRGQ